MKNILDNISVILCNTTHSGNLGSTARAMKTMGIKTLVLINPIAKIDDHAIALASNAADILENVKIYHSLDNALQGTTLSIALTSRKREFRNKIYTPKEITPQILGKANSNQKVALVFGAEKNGLTIEELEKCNTKVTIPGNPEYFSLNLSQAVQILCYEIYSQFNPSLKHLEAPINSATFEDNQRILSYIGQILNKTTYNKKNEDLLKRRLQNIIYKANLEKEEADLLHGVFKKVLKQLG